MISDNKKLKKFFSIIVGFAIGILFALPYLLFKEKIQEFSTLGYIGLFLSCFVSNLSILLPTSSTIIIIAASLTLNPFICIVVGGIGTAFGEQASYVCGLIGSSGFDISTKKGKEITTKWFERNSFLTVLLFAFVPLPVFDIIGIIAGAKRMSWWKYTLAAVLGKVLKFTLVIVSLFYLLPFLLDKLPFGWGKILSDNLNQLLTSIK